MKKPLLVAVAPTLLDEAFAGLGYELAILSPGPGIHDAAALCAERGLVPDLFLQREVLGPRTLLCNLEALACPTVFWSLDTHLNAWWQGHYGRLFGRVVCTQKDWLPALASMGVERPGWLPWPGEARGVVPFGARAHQAAFVGRITDARPVRMLFADFLSREGLADILPETPREDMLRLYGQTRLIPNETILGEVNWRVFEAASCGALALHPLSGIGTDNGIAELFEPGREIAVFSDALELGSLLRHYRKNAAEAEKMALAGRARVLAEHLPEHRAQAIARAAQSPATPLTGPEAARELWLAAALLFQAGILPVGLQALVSGLEAHLSDPACFEAILRCRYVSGKKDEALAMAHGLLAAEALEGDLGLDAACSGLCLREGRFDTAKAFWYRRARAAGDACPDKPEDPAALLALWARELAQAGAAWRPGFSYDPDADIPASALECLLSARIHAPGDIRLLARLEAFLRGLPGSEYVRLGCLADISLRQPNDWRVGVRLGLLDLRLFRLAEGLDEIGRARTLAASRGEAVAFERFLRGAGGARLAGGAGAGGGSPLEK
jgi:hypothetical protein